MKKYNLSNIMKRAWELVKKSALTISSGLKKAWEEAKTMEQKLVELVGSPKQIAWAEDIRKNMISYLSALVRKYEAEDRPARAENRPAYRENRRRRISRTVPSRKNRKAAQPAAR